VPPSFDDKILEVVAVFGGMQIAVSRLIDLQHHRIAQVSDRSLNRLNDISQDKSSQYQFIPQDLEKLFVKKKKKRLNNKKW
jgi:hypothetical protein